MSLEQQSEAILQLMLADMEEAPPLLHPTPFWANWTADIVNDIELYGIENFQTHPSAQHLYAGATSLPKAAADYQCVLAEDRPHAPCFKAYSQSQVGKPWQLYEHGGKRYSLTALNYLRGLAFLKQKVSTNQIRTVLEIGGGFGCLGEILLTSPSAPYLYINIDIPPVAAVATYYLKALFGEQVLDYSNSRKLETIDLEVVAQEYRAVVLCPWQLSRLQGSVDLGVNFISFQEMEPAVVDHYANELTRLQTEYLLLRNSQTGKPGTDQPVTRDTVQQAFGSFSQLATDTDRFGNRYVGLVSEVLIMQRDQLA